MTIFRRCINCGTLFTGLKCKQCASKMARKSQKDNEKRRVYGEYRWRKCRENAIIRFMGYDIWLLAIGKIVVCKRPVVHHIIERDEAPELIYRLDNLIVCTVDSHAEIHECYRKDKASALKRIAKGMEIFKEMFGDGS